MVFSIETERFHWYALSICESKKGRENERERDSVNELWKSQATDVIKNRMHLPIHFIRKPTKN